jgi:hypothetical protein
MHTRTEKEREWIQNRLKELSPHDRMLFKFYITRIHEREQEILVRKRIIRKTAAVYRCP